MKIENITPNIIQLKFYQEKTDNDYGSCLWGNVIIDCANYTLLIESDCGSYSYGWIPTPNTESFVKLLCRMNSDYLLGKISDMSYFDFEKSKEQTYKNIRKYFEYDSANKAQEIIENLDYNLDLAYGEESFYRACEEAFYGYNVCNSFEIIHIEKDYPAGAKKIADIFKNTIQPYLRENFLNDEILIRKGVKTISKILYPVFGGKEWCVPWKCPCLTCELWINDDIEPDCACKPCSVPGLRDPQDVWCWKTSETCRAIDKLTMKFIPSRKEISERSKENDKN